VLESRGKKTAELGLFSSAASLVSVGALIATSILLPKHRRGTGLAVHPPRGCGKESSPYNQPQSVWNRRFSARLAQSGEARVGRRDVLLDKGGSDASNQSSRLTFFPGLDFPGTFGPLI